VAHASHLQVILLMRTWDEAAKVQGLRVPTWENYSDTIRALVIQNAASSGGSSQCVE
jgi:hypothetical protein